MILPPMILSVSRVVALNLNKVERNLNAQKIPNPHLTSHLQRARSPNLNILHIVEEE